MKTSDYIMYMVDRLPKGYVFTYADFVNEVNKREAIIKALNRLVASGKISKLSKGKFYKPESTVFGALTPNEYQVVKDLLEENGKITGYLTGYSIYNKLGLTTQVSNTIEIGKNNIRSKFSREPYTIRFVKQKNTITKENVPLLQLLDTIRYIKKIPDTTVIDACYRLLSIITKLCEKDCSTLVRLAQKYPPATRALTGALLDGAGKRELTEPLLRSLNPITKYNLSGVEQVLPTVQKWNIV